MFFDRNPRSFTIGATMLLLALVGCTPDDSENGVVGTSLDVELESALIGTSGGMGKAFFTMPESNNLRRIPQDPNNPITNEKVALGQFLFHETGLAMNPLQPEGMGTYSCSSCHSSQAGFMSGVKQGIGEGGSGYGFSGESRVPNGGYALTELDVQPVRVPSNLNAAYLKVVLWNGELGANGPNAGTESQWTPNTGRDTNKLGYDGPETQAIVGLTAHRMVIDKDFLDNNGYTSLFDQAFPNMPTNRRYTTETAGLAIAAYERTMLANQSPFQLWLRGQNSALTESQKKGAILFFGSAGCVECHRGPALNSIKFHAICMDDLDGDGVYGTSGSTAEAAALGRGGFTGNPDDNYKFKVPQLYNLVNSPFYGHGSTFTSVRDVIVYKNEAKPQNDDVPNAHIATSFQPLHLSETEIDQLTDFIENGLYDPNLARYTPTSLPSGNCFPNADPQSMIDLGCN